MKDQKRLNCSGRFSLIKKIAISLCLGMMAVLFFANCPVQAKKNYIKLTLDPPTNTHHIVWLEIKIPLPEKDIKLLEYKRRNIKKTNDVYWKKATKLHYMADWEDKNSTSTSFYVEKNGTYTVRLTTTSGKKYIKTVKINNIQPCSERSGYRAVIKNISKVDKDGNYTVTVDYFKQYSTNVDDLKGKKVGDILDVNGEKVFIVNFYEGEPSSNFDSFEPVKMFSDSCVIVVCVPENSVISNEKDGKYIYTYNKRDEFGFVRYGNSTDTFFACDNYVAEFEGGDILCNEKEYLAYENVKLKVTKNTIFELAYSHENYKGEYPDRRISGTKYCSLLGNDSRLEREGFYSIIGKDVHIYEVYDKKKNEFTDEISEMIQIYYP